MHTFKPGSFADRAHPTMRSAPIESLTVAAAQDWTVVPLTNREVDRSARARHKRDGRWLVALAHNVKRAMTAFESEIFNIGCAGFGHPQPVETEQHSERDMGMIEPFSSEQERAKLTAIHPAAFARLNLGTSHVMGRVGRDSAVDVREPVVATHC